MGGRFLLGPLRRAATALANTAVRERHEHRRAVLRVATASGAARLHQRASPSLLPPTPLAGFSCRKRETLEVIQDASLEFLDLPIERLLRKGKYAVFCQFTDESVLHNMTQHQPNIEPRGLNREEAAAYVGVGTTFFDVLVKEGRMPKPKLINTRKVWDRREVDIAFDRLPNDCEKDDEPNPFDGVRA